MAAPNECPAIRVMMMPRDTNAHGTIFGGVMLSYIDQAGAIEARRNWPHRFVTVAMDKVVFKQPVHVGDVVSFYAKVTRVGRTSVTIQVDVEALPFNPPHDVVSVTSASVAYVAIDENDQPLILGQPVGR